MQRTIRCRSAETERGWMDEKDIIRTDIKSKKERLSIGEQYYEYKTVVVQDSAVLGKTDVEMIDLTLNKYAVEGWRLKAAITNEMGHNRAVVVNATINNTILIFERLVTKEQPINRHKAQGVNPKDETRAFYIKKASFDATGRSISI